MFRLLFPYVLQHNQEPADGKPDKGIDPAGKEGEEKGNQFGFPAISVPLSHSPCKCTIVRMLQHVSGVQWKVSLLCSAWSYVRNM